MSVENLKNELIELLVKFNNANDCAVSNIDLSMTDLSTLDKKEVKYSFVFKIEA